MKITKMSLVAALLVGSSAFAIDNTKVSGDANVFYHTSDTGTGNILDSGTSGADVGINLNITTDLLKNDSVSISAGAGYTLLTTLGLEGQMVDMTIGGAHNGVKDASWMNEAWMATTAAKTTVKIGRMELDTPLAYTETWSIEKNTFDAGVLINNDMEDTTLVGAYIGRGNGRKATPATATGAIVDTDGTMSAFGVKGAYAVAVINNSWKPLTAQAWYYDVVSVAQAYWLQGDLDLGTLGAKGVTTGVQYTALSNDAAAYALMVGYDVKDTMSVQASMSQVNNKGAAGYNTATSTSAAQSKLYTEAWWNYGKITQADNTAFNITVTAPFAGYDLGAYFTTVDQANVVNNAAANNDMTELTLSASRSVGPVDATLVYIYADTQDNNPATTDGSNTVQVYLTANF